jgi:hypothetical protein
MNKILAIEPIFFFKEHKSTNRWTKTKLQWFEKTFPKESSYVEYVYAKNIQIHDA